MSGFPSETGGDRLAQIEELRRTGQLGAITVSDVIALVEVAKAARLRTAFGHDKHCAWVTGGPNPPSCDCGHVELCDALARLDSEAAEEDA